MICSDDKKYSWESGGSAQIFMLFLGMLHNIDMLYTGGSFFLDSFKRR